jgi:hypothetical protein
MLTRNKRKTKIPQKMIQFFSDIETYLDAGSPEESAEPS